MELATAAGARIKDSEHDLLRGLLHDQWSTFNAQGLEALEALVGEASPSRVPTSFRFADRFLTGVAEQSALTFISPKHGFIAVDDETSVVWQLEVPGSSKSPKIRALRQDDNELKGLEGAAYDPKARQLLVVSEDNRRVHSMDVNLKRNELSLGEPQEMGKLPRWGDGDNKGWEGIMVWPASQAPDGRAHILAVHEGQPMGLGIFERDSLRTEAMIELHDFPGGPKDLSDLTIDPQTGRLFLLSDESRAIYEMNLIRTSKSVGAGPPIDRWSMVFIERTKLPEMDGKGRLQPEGLAFDHEGNLWVSSEGDRSMVKLERD